MKMYRLKTNVCISDFEREKYSIYGTVAGDGYLRNYDGEYGICHKDSFYYHGKESRFTQDQIDLIPNGIFKKFDVIEIEVDKYNIVCPVTSGILVEVQDSGKKIWMDNGYNYPYNTIMYKRCFTEQEIKEKFGCYANETFMVKINK